MKKLLTTVSAVAVALGLYATDTGTSFEGLSAGDYDITATTGELTAQAAGTSYWVTNDIDGLELKVVNDPRIIANADRPDKYADAGLANYLHVKTPIGSPVTRNVSVGGTGTAIGDGFYFDSLVKFTAFDEDQAIDLNGGKLAIWLRENLNANDEPTSTNLMITAGFLGANLQDVVATNYECAVDGVNFNDGAWHRVTVKAIDNIYSTTPKVPGFVVFVDKHYAYTTAEPGTPMAEKGINRNSLSNNAREFHVACRGALFPSADQTSNDKSAIAAVQFAGQGDVDDLVFTPDAPNGMADYAFFTIKLGANVASVTYTDGTTTATITEDTLIVYTSGLGVKFTNVVYSNGYMNAAATYASGVTADDETEPGSIWYEPSAAEQWVQVNAVQAGATVTGNGTTENCETLADAITYVNNRPAGSGTYTITMAANASGNIDIDNAGITNILDLAGHTFTGTSTENAAILVTAGALTIVDSEGGGVVQSAVSEGALVDAVGYDAGTVTIQAGTYNGKVSATAITGGGFLATYNGGDVNTKADLDPMIVGNYEATINPGTNYYVLTEKATYVAQIGEQGYETLAAAVAAAKTLGDASAPVTITLLSDVTAGGIQLTANNFSGYGLVLDLGGHTYTMNAQTEKDPIDVRTNNIFTVSNGTLAVSYAARDIARIYGGPTTVVTFKDVTISGANLEASASDKPVGVFQIEGGSVNIIGSTSINSGSAPYAIKFGNHANKTQYVCGTVTVNTTGNIIGDVLLTGGTYDETAIGAGSDIDYYYGTNVWSTWEDANNVVFAARDGELSAVGDENDVSGNLYKEFAQAFAATNEFTLLKNYAGNVAFAMDTKIKANGYELTGTLTAPAAGYEVRVIDGVYQVAAAVYAITYELGGGTAGSGTATEYTYSAAAQTATIVDPTCEGSNFVSWTISPVEVTISGTTLSIPAGQTGAITLTATWEAAGGWVYPNYLNNAGAEVKAQYDTWADANNVASGDNDYEAAFLLNVDPLMVGATLNVTAVSVSSGTVTININHAVNGYAYVKKAATVAGLGEASKTAVTVIPADNIENGARITLTGESAAAQFYQIGVQSAPVAVPNAD